MTEPSVWDELVGQEPAVAVLRRALAGVSSGRGVTHAWLITGPPGSGRSNAARAFAAALRCERSDDASPGARPTESDDPADSAGQAGASGIVGASRGERGCGQCNGCRTALTGASPDVTLVSTEHLSIKVDEIRELVRKAAMSPVAGPYQVLIVEDADRLTEQAADALLKSLEEPPDRTVWLLCAPTVADVVPTIRSRCRLLVLRTPPAEAVAAMLRDTDGVDPEIARFSASASQGHIGRARALARSDEVRQARRRVLALPTRLDGVATAITAAAELVSEASEEAKNASAALDAAERAELEEAFSIGTGTVPSKGAKGAKAGRAAVRKPRNRTLDSAKKELEEQQKVRAKRLQRDVLDRALLDLQSYYRDVLMLGMRGPKAELVNEDLRAELAERAARARPGSVLRQIDAIAAARTALEENVAPLLALEQMALSLRSAG